MPCLLTRRMVNYGPRINLGMITSKDRLVSHLQYESELNGNPFGLRVISNANPHVPDVEKSEAPWKPDQPKPNDNLIWPAGSIDWSILEIYLGGKVDESMEEANKVISNQRLALDDQWDYTDLNNNWNGRPWANSHYTRQLILWGPRLRFPDSNGTPRQAPDVQPGGWCSAAAAILYPQATGVIDSVATGKWRIEVTSGQLALQEVQISNANWKVDKTLNAGNSVYLSSTSSTLLAPKL